ncbi:hypothetical protein VTN96DRAFT_2719 [Rasamsonia emersonii]|uniref:Uncharacterized protein n=1 Tax=Rasamsonia emersonii (strain ATCC 16479 / CBS 393.64 / IMI 116815) TaxID=1408163 RepID=A0A0F4YRS0_RASE3|nr:hypothetical protein T310_5029 [Rasamsonia emersonii CBS 393.64]KKA20944.1 hypothetical protein T310_5029 [Rasamsonia emersonii CBS 393.64]
MVLRRALPLRLSQCVYRSFSHSAASLQLSPFTRRLFKLPAAPPPASLNHHDLPSFLSYAERTGLPASSTTYVGTHYEYTVLQSLRRFAFALHRVGGRDDAGIDLVGTWHLPRRAHALRVVVQCKALKTKLGPNLVRELEGAFRHSPVGWRTSEKVAILVSPREATKGVRDAMARSDYPLFWIMMERDGTIRQALWNGKVEALGLGALGVETRYREHSSDPAQKDIILTWDDEEFPHMDRVEEDMAKQEAEWVATWGCERLSETGKVELLEMVETAFPDLGPGHALEQIDQSSLAAKKAEFLALLEEKSPRSGQEPK